MEIIVYVWRFEGGQGQTGSHHVTQDVLNSESSCLRILGVGIIDVHHHTWLMLEDQTQGLVCARQARYH